VQVKPRAHKQEPSRSHQGF